MYETSVNDITANQVSSKTQPVCAGFNLVGFFVGDKTMKRIPLTQGKVAIIDDADFEEFSKYKWCAMKNGNTFYAVRNYAQPIQMNIWMHRVIMNAQKGQEIDHINGNGLDNRRYNLRLCTRSQNHQNQRIGGGSSQYKGVCWNKQAGKWQAQIMLNYKTYYLGHFVNEIDAAKAYDRKAKGLFGEFARLNNIYWKGI